MSKADTLCSFSLGDFKSIPENVFVQEMSDKAEDQGWYPSSSEKKSWFENCKALKTLFSKSKLPDDVYICFEYQIPVGGGRIDCMLFGKDKSGQANAIHIELKQWSNENVEPHYDGRMFKTTVVVDGYRGDPKHSSHPSAQAEEYQMHLSNYIIALETNDITLTGLSYCYNYVSTVSPNIMCGSSFTELLKRCPMYCKDQCKELAAKLDSLLDGGKGDEVYEAFINSEVRETKKLQDSAKVMFDGRYAEKEFALVGDQLDAYNEIMGAIEDKDREGKKTVVIVKGGPGTGKSVIAMRLISGLAKAGYDNVFYSTRSTSLINGFKEILKDINYKDGKDNSAIDLIMKNSRVKPIRGESGIDALIVDEAHRIEKKSNDMNDSDPEVKTHLSQIMNMLFCSRVSVFFIDDRQSVKSIEIGTSEKIKEAAENYLNRITEENKKYREKEYPKLKKKLEKAEKKLEDLEAAGVSEKKQRELEKQIKSLRNEIKYGLKWVETTTPKVKDVNVVEIELKDQFRCNGSNNYIDWIEQVLYMKEGEGKVKLDKSKYEFDVFDTPQELYAKIRSLDDFAKYSDGKKSELGDDFSYKRISEESDNMEFPQKARLVAGWCWEWKQKRTEPNGDLKHEITIPEHEFSIPWETLKQGGRKPTGDFKYKYAPNQDIWILDRRGVNQVGCNHSAQGWEVDYVGVIIAGDLKFDTANKRLYGDVKVRNYDKNVSQINPDFTRITQNIYRVLLTRGKKGCFVYCCDPQVAEYFKRCMDK